MSIVNKRNTIYENEVMYNEERKKGFLSQYSESEGTQRTYQRIFLISSGLEETWDKDLVDFNLDEIKELLHGTNPLSRDVCRSTISTVYNYIKWGIENGYRTSQSNIHPLDGVRNSKSFINEFIKKDIELYISKQELDDICDQLINVQDKAVLHALFNGITTDQLRYMKTVDINDDNTVYLRDNHGELVKDIETGENFKLELDEDCASLLRKASESQYYHVKNGEPSKNSRIVTVDLIESEYVIKVAKLGSATDDSNPVNYHVIKRKLDDIKKWFMIPYITPKSINKSGMLYEGYKLWVADGKPDYPKGVLKTEQYHSILKKYNTPKLNNGSYNIHTLKGYVNIENFKRYYEE